MCLAAPRPAATPARRAASSASSGSGTSGTTAGVGCPHALATPPHTAAAVPEPTARVCTAAATTPPCGRTPQANRHRAKAPAPAYTRHPGAAGLGQLTAAAATLHSVRQAHRPAGRPAAIIPLAAEPAEQPRPTGRTAEAERPHVRERRRVTTRGHR